METASFSTAISTQERRVFGILDKFRHTDDVEYSTKLYRNALSEIIDNNGKLEPIGNIFIAIMEP